MLYSLPRLLDQIRSGFGSGRRYFRMCDLIADAARPAGAVILRFDVERDLKHHLAIARELAGLQIAGSIYFHTRRECFDPGILCAIQDLGHEVGYHHECLDRCGGRFAEARRLFEREVALFRSHGIQLRTVCSHGEVGIQKRGYSSNKDLFKVYPELLAELQLQGEVYHWVHARSLHYATDTFSSYRQFWHTLSQARSTSKPLMLLVHLHRWHSNPAQISLEVCSDLLQYARNRVFHQRNYRLAY